MNQHTSYATATKLEVFEPDRAAAAQLGADGCQAGRTGSCVAVRISLPMTTVKGAPNACAAARLRRCSSESTVGSKTVLGRRSREEPPEWRSRKALPRGKISFATKSDICCVMEPSASPGK